MFQELDNIPWATLEHAYGSAEDVPVNLRALMSEDAATREAAREELWGSIIHQGTVYAATAPAVPFLIELLDNTSVPDKADLLTLLSSLSGGSSYHAAHAHLDALSGFREVGSEAWQETVDEEMEWVNAAHQAVVTGMPVYLRLLKQGAELEARCAATLVLANCAEQRDVVIPALAQAMQEAPAMGAGSDAVQASCLMALAHLARVAAEYNLDDAAELNEMVVATAQTRLGTNQSPLIRTVAALSLAELLREQAPGEVAAILEQTLKKPSEVDEAFRALPWSDDESIVSAISSAIVPLARTDVARWVNLLIDALPQGEGWETHEEATRIAQTVVGLCNLEVRNPDPFAQNRISSVPSELTPFQQETLLRLCDTFDTWTVVDGDLVLQFRLYGLPDPRQLRAFFTA